MAEDDRSKALQAVLEHIATDPAFRKKLEDAPLEILDEFGINLDEETRAALEGKRFSEFVAVIEAQAANGAEELTLEEADRVAGGTLTSTFAPPYIPVSPVRTGMLTEAWSELLNRGAVNKFKKF